MAGGGITGLAAALRLHERGADPLLLEASDRLGGAIATERTDGFVIERGAESFLTEKPWGTALCERLGIAGDLVGTRPGERRTLVVRDGRLCPLPEGFLLLAPTRPWPLLASPLFSWPGKLRMLLEPLVPARRDAGDESLAAFVRRRLGAEALDRVADALVGGIYTADPERLSLAATMPRFLDLERRYGSVVRGLRATAPPATGAAGVRYGLFATPREGMQALVEAIARRLPPGSVRLGTPVEGITRGDTGWEVAAGADRLTADGVVVATPAGPAAGLLARLDGRLGELLGGVAHASSATVTLAFREADVAAHLRGFGFVVPFAERRALLAATFSSRKFPHRAPAGHELVRGFVGGARRPDLPALDDAALVRLVRDELRALVGIVAAPVLVRVHRWRDAMPQYALGHLERVAEIEARVAALPGLALAGAAHRGVGIPDCIRGGEAAADALALA